MNRKERKTRSGSIYSRNKEEMIDAEKETQKKNEYQQSQRFFCTHHRMQP